VAAKVLEGRVAILCDGTPFVLTVPYLLVEAIQSSEDYYSRSVYSIMNRFIRLLALFITSFLPAYYVALVNFHQDIIPYKLLLTMTASREGIPFSALIEALIMVITFELLREAGVRMPRAIGQAVSIVGALVIGDAAVKAGLVSTPMVIVIAITAISSFIVTPLSSALLIVRIVSMLAANIIGILGVLFASIFFFISMCKTKSFGIDYLSPFTPLSGTDLKDTVVRFPLWAMLTRPKPLTWENSKNAKYRNKRHMKGNKIL
jgi:spore germination protein KA